MSHMRHVTLLVLALLAAGPETSGPASQPARRASGVQTGAVAGEVHASAGAPRRTAERYSAGAGGGERAVQTVPAVVYLQGGSAAAGSAPSTRPRLMQKDTTFAPGALVVQVGTTVEFPNGDPFFHNVFSYSRPKRFDLGRYPQGESKQVHFDRPGIVKIYCEVHRSMRALVVVVDGPHFAVVGDDGRFTIEDVPVGRYQLVVVDADRGTRTSNVVVAEGRTTRVAVSLP